MAGLAVGTIKNRMAKLRWWAEKIGKQNVVARDNDHYGIGHRQYVTNVSKARELTAGDLAKINHRPVHAGDVAAATGLVRIAAWGIDQDPARVGGSQRQAGSERHLDQGRPRAGNPHP